MKNIIVTGSNRGIGLGIVQHFLEFDEFLVYGTLRSGAHSISHTRFKPLYLNLTSSESISSMVDRIEGLKFDVLINNAGVLLDEEFQDSLNLDVLKNTFEVNLFGTVDLTERLIPILNDNSTIINITSSWGAHNNDQFDKRFPAYRMSKAALIMYSKTLNKRLEKINVIDFDPGWVNTDMGGAQAPKTANEVAVELSKLLG